MKLTIFFFFIACLVALVVSDPETCPLVCSRKYQPVCGMQEENGKMVKRNFPNECEMRDANECDGGNYVPCE